MKKDLKHKLTDIQYDVTQNCGTEKPFDNEYWDNKEEGIYVDIVDGTPLFCSKHKYDSGSGWPSFYKPISNNSIKNSEDYKLGYKRTELKSIKSNSHLGHVFEDGPSNKTGLRYCINSASLRFIPKDEMKNEGYEDFLDLFK
tara:strand:- start:13 stop:438 length:426 start_codon:yes stop_codon:yes gene_type:complete